MMKKILSLIIILSCCTSLFAQEDTITTKYLDTVLIRGYRDKFYMPDVSGVSVYAGKKTNVVHLDGGKMNLAQNVARMAFAEIPGLNVWDMDGAGTQINVGSRGTDTHRSIEMNMRQNGYNINSDMFGYPEDHYTPPMNAIQQIQLVRGSAALQYGSQFGGMMNFVMKEGTTQKPFAIESEQTTGSYNFFNSYNAVSGKVGKVSYYAYYDNRHGNGWRQSAAFNYHAYYANVKYAFNDKGSVTFQFSRMSYRQQIAGGLTDGQFDANARQATRNRNFFNPEINIPALIFNYDLSSNTHLQISTHQLYGQRNSVQFINTPNIADTVNTKIGSYNPRQVDRDYYNGVTSEARLLHRYTIGGVRSTLTGGVRYFNEVTTRRQKGVGTTGSDFDLSLVKPYGIDLHFHTLNYAAFVENLFQITHRFSVTPGFRYEVIHTTLDGVIVNATFPVLYKGNRSFPLFGSGLQYQLTSWGQLYGNISQAYRPYLYANVTPADQIGVIDPNLKDSRGHDADLGYRGHIADIFKFDVNAFYLFYGNRIGQLTLKDGNTTRLFTTNIGNSLTKGVETYVNVSLWKLMGGKPVGDIRIFNSLSYNHARYTQGSLSINGENLSLQNHKVEGVPDWIERGGLELRYKGISTTMQISYVGKSFSDANNTVYNSTGATGVVPSYHILDWAFNWSLFRNYHVSFGVNNLGNAKYFTRRINMYPGPGILPADGRTFYVSLGFKID